MADSEQVLELSGSTGRCGDYRDRRESEGCGASDRDGSRFHSGISLLCLARSSCDGIRIRAPEDTLEALETVGQAAFQAGLSMVAYISMAFGNPYGDPWSTGRSRGGLRSAGGFGHDADFAGRYRRPGELRRRSPKWCERFWARWIPRWRSGCICMRVPAKQRRRWRPPITRAAGALTWRSAVSVDVLLPRTRWSATFPPRSPWLNWSGWSGTAAAAAAGGHPRRRCGDRTALFSARAVGCRAGLTRAQPCAGGR